MSSFRGLDAHSQVEIFYVTSRDQGEKTYEYAMGHLRHLGFPSADDRRLSPWASTNRFMMF